MKKINDEKSLCKYVIIFSLLFIPSYLSAHSPGAWVGAVFMSLLFALSSSYFLKKRILEDIIESSDFYFWRKLLISFVFEFFFIAFIFLVVFSKVEGQSIFDILLISSIFYFIPSVLPNIFLLRKNQEPFKNTMGSFKNILKAFGLSLIFPVFLFVCTVLFIDFFYSVFE